MRTVMLAIAALVPIAALAQTAVTPDPATLPIRAGSWAYSTTPAASEASFMDSSGTPQVVLRCVRATRTVTLSLRAVPATSVTVWTSSASRSLPATYDAMTARLTTSFAANDPLLDAVAFSRGRISFSAAGSAPLVVPAWPEPARAIEDCRN